MTMQDTPTTSSPRSGEPQALRRDDSSSPAIAIGTVASTTQTTKRKSQAPKRPASADRMAPPPMPDTSRQK